MSAIFLSYRRDDSSGYAGRLFDNLEQRFGRERVFMDIETLEPGVDFVEGIDRAIQSCGALIALIGPNWIRAQDSDGRPRLDNPHDFIRLEIVTALNRGVRVIPVLVHNARMPQEAELPEPLRPLCRLQACEISDHRWEFDVRRLADVIEPLIAEGKESQEGKTADPAGGAKGVTQTSGGRPIGWLGMLAVLVVAMAGGVWWFSGPPSSAPDFSAPHATPPITSGSPAPEPTPPATPDPDLPPDPAPATQTPVVAVPEPVDEPLPQPPPGREPAVDAKAFALPAEPGPSAEALRQGEIADLIRAAEVDLAELRLTRPAGDNAFERYQRVLELEPRHPAAREGLRAIIERYRGLIEDALVAGAPDRAQRHLDAARTVDPDDTRLAELQREIEHRRETMARPAPRAEPAPRPDRAELEACLSDCERQHEACRVAAQRESEADCLRSAEETCEQRYQSCMSDPGRLFMGEVSRTSECAGVHAQCRKAAASDCATALHRANERCETRLETCIERCRGLQ
jgi:hypothetical protein